MNDDSILGEALETLGDTVKQGAKQIAQTPAHMAKAAMGQVSGNADSNEEFVNDLYGSQNKTQQTKAATQPNQHQNKPQNPKEIEDQAKIASLRKQLHEEYYEDLTKKNEEPEERAGEKRDREEQEEKQRKLAEIEEKKSKDLSGLAPQAPGDPIPVTRAKTTTEINRGVSG